jgi:hypothetical protein
MEFLKGGCADMEIRRREIEGMCSGEGIERGEISHICGL